MALDNNYGRLTELGGSDFEIADGEPDIKGWDVKNIQGKRIGVVDELLFDPAARKVRYLIVNIDDNELGIDDDKTVLIPIGTAEIYSTGRIDDTDTDTDVNGNDLQNDTISRARTNIDEGAEFEETFDAGDESDVYNAADDGDVVIVSITADQLIDLPAYEKNNITAKTESDIRRILEGVAGAGTTSNYNQDDFYNHDHFNENKFYGEKLPQDTEKLPVIEENLQVGKREIETGGARITSRIVQHPVEERINLKEEQVTVERNPVDRPVSPDDATAFTETEFEVTEHAEIPVITKEARVIEEISLNKEVKEKDETIRETLRNTEVEAERIDSKKTRQE